MDRDDAFDLDLVPVTEWELPLGEPPEVELGDGDSGQGPPPPGERTGGGRGGSGSPRPDPFFHSRWAALVPAAVIVLFGSQTLLVLWVSRSGMGSEVVAWLIASLFVLSFTAVFIAGARYIARHRDGA